VSSINAALYHFRPTWDSKSSTSGNDYFHKLFRSRLFYCQKRTSTEQQCQRRAHGHEKQRDRDNSTHAVELLEADILKSQRQQSNLTFSPQMENLPKATTEQGCNQHRW